MALRLTDCAEPVVNAVLTVEVWLEPWAMLSVVGLAPIEKSSAVVPLQLEILKEPICVLQLNAPFAGMYWFVYQKVQSSLGSTLMLV